MLKFWRAYDPSGGEFFWLLACALILAVGLAAGRPSRWPAWKRWLLWLSGFSFAAAGLGWSYWPLTSQPPFAFLWICLPLQVGVLAGVSVWLPPRARLLLGSLLLGALPGVLWMAYQRPYLTGARAREIYSFGYPLGYQPLPNREHLVAKVCKGRTLYRVRYRFDEYGRRWMVPRPQASRSLLCFGCSVTMGEGVEGDETWPAVLAARHPEVAVYNYGVSGYGPAQMLDQIRSRRLSQEVVLAPAQACYFLISSHTYRLQGHWYVVGGWGGGFSRYRLQGSQLVRLGSFGETMTPWEFLACYSLAGWGLHRYLAPPDKDVPDSEAKDLLVAVLLESQRALDREFGSCPLTVAVRYRFGWAEELKSRLAAGGVRTWRQAESKPLPRIAGDGHPDARGHQWIADAIEPAFWAPTP